MKIISKFKDYYDYLVGIYSEDPLLVFDRRSQNGTVIHKFSALPEEWQAEYGDCVGLAHLFVGNWHTWLFYTGQEVYTTSDIETVYSHVRHNKKYAPIVRFKNGKEYAIPSESRWHIPHDYFLATVTRSHYEMAAYRHVPLVLIIKKHYWNESDSYYANPQLVSLGIYVDENVVWQEISAYLGQLRSEQETSPPVPDKNKIENKGFDVKHSFCPEMKK
ncbi:hypothetical protein MIS45_00880 [Wielerella bovis]|uniref:hypothetical protein n=1 Tax=Wielerella bovis TaxID=2917790 RepID=UPI002018B98A|nr:hypothetical protein [Wielerella bovis]ULJ69459.1 hypothetical protein MIS45_00880 [Wielerella bovis]